MGLLLVTYGIAHDRRRARLHTLLSEFGVQVQESVFECELDETSARTLRRRLRALARREDNNRLYLLCATCLGQVIDAKGKAVRENPAFYAT